MARKVIHGQGMTAREHVALESPADFRQWAKSWNDAIKEGGGIFGAVSLGAADICQQILAEAADGIPVEDTPEAFARGILRCRHLALVEIQRGNADLAARNAWDAGVRWATARMKWRWENYALGGEKAAKVRAEWAERTNAPRKQIGDKRMKLMEELVLKKRMKVSKAAAECGRGDAKEAENIRQQWYARRRQAKV
jgi:hypothetical protein